MDSLERYVDEINENLELELQCMLFDEQFDTITGSKTSGTAPL